MSTSSTPNNSPHLGDLGLGATGTPVSEMQAKLNLLGFGPIEVTGAFDGPTQTAVQRFQTRVRLPVTGNLGATDEQLLNNAVLATQSGSPPATGTMPLCPRPIWQTALMVTGALALAYGAWTMLQQDDKPRSSLPAGRSEREMGWAARVNGVHGDLGKCSRTPSKRAFLDAPTVEA